MWLAMADVVSAIFSPESFYDAYRGYYVGMSLEVDAPRAALRAVESMDHADSTCLVSMVNFPVRAAVLKPGSRWAIYGRERTERESRA